MDELIFSNGIDMETGAYALPPLPIDDLDALLRGEEPAANIASLTARVRDEKHLGLMANIDARKLTETGWAVVFADDADPQVETALAPLLDLRREQADRLYQRLTFVTGKDTSGARFLARYGPGPGPVDPELVPYYLLLVGSPEKIPYSVQSQLDVDYAVGRIDFRTPEEYAAYARSVVAAERGAIHVRRRLGFFDTGRELTVAGDAGPAGTPRTADIATSQSAQYLVRPLLDRFAADKTWLVDTLRGEAATKAALSGWLGAGPGDGPALVFTACHGLEVKPQNALNRTQAEYQGALVCADWPGPGHPVTDESFFFAGKDLPADADLRGRIALFFACFGAGTPRLDAFSRLQRLRLGQQPGPASQIAAQSFVAELPRRMLAAPAGGALAVIGHVERTWPTSFLWKAKEDGTLPPQTAAFQSALRTLMDGYPVGAAVEYLNERYASLAVMLKDLLESVQFGEPYDRVELANTWVASNDAQWYTVVGDPAVRLPLVADGGKDAG